MAFAPAALAHLLQLGRSRKTAESRQALVDIEEANEASIGPQS